MNGWKRHFKFVGVENVEWSFGLTFGDFFGDQKLRMLFPFICGQTKASSNALDTCLCQVFVFRYVKTPRHFLCPATQVALKCVICMLGSPRSRILYCHNIWLVKNDHFWRVFWMFSWIACFHGCEPIKSKISGKCIAMNNFTNEWHWSSPAAVHTLSKWGERCGPFEKWTFSLPLRNCSQQCCSVKTTNGSSHGNMLSNANLDILLLLRLRTIAHQGHCMPGLFACFFSIWLAVSYCAGNEPRKGRQGRRVKKNARQGVRHPCLCVAHRQARMPWMKALAMRWSKCPRASCFPYSFALWSVEVCSEGFCSQFQGIGIKWRAPCAQTENAKVNVSEARLYQSMLRSSAFEALEKDFQEVLQECLGNRCLSSA